MKWSELLAGVHGAGMTNMTIGLVTSVDDPENMNRVKLTYPLLSDLESDWVRVMTPFAGAEYGFFFHPKAGNEVLVAFLHNRVDQPYVLGALYNGEDKPPVESEQQQTVGRLKTPGGQVFTMDDSEDSKNITIIDAKSNKIVIDTEKSEITIYGGQDISVTAAEGDMTLKASAGTINASGLNINVTAEEKLSLKAPTISVVADESLSLQASASVSVKGGMIELN